MRRLLVCLWCAYVLNNVLLYSASCCAPNNKRRRTVQCCNKKLSSTDAEIVRHARRWTHWLLPSTCKTPHISHSGRSSSVEFWITGYYDPGRRRHAASQDTDLSCTFPVNVALCDHSSPTLQTDRQTGRRTDGRHACSMSARCIYRACRAKKETS